MAGVVRGDALWEQMYKGHAKDRHARATAWITRAQWSDWRGQTEDPFYAEGWDLICHNSSSTRVAIRLERADGEGWFRTDAQAMAYVKRRAAEGSKLHQRALSLIGETY